MPFPRKRLRDRFEEKVSPEPMSGCHLWIGGYGIGTRTAGYGRIAAPGGSPMLRAHRVAWELYRGPIPDGLLVLHKCDVTICVNPEHLFLGTDRDNYHDALEKGRRSLRYGLGLENALKTHCPRGHPYSGDNLLIARNGGRCCRRCSKDRSRAQRRDAKNPDEENGRKVAKDAGISGSSISEPSPMIP